MASDAKGGPQTITRFSWRNSLNAVVSSSTLGVEISLSIRGASRDRFRCPNPIQGWLTTKLSGATAISAGQRLGDWLVMTGIRMPLWAVPRQKLPRNCSILKSSLNFD
jgi:hypothetical protein